MKKSKYYDPSEDPDGEDFDDGIRDNFERDIEGDHLIESWDDGYGRRHIQVSYLSDLDLDDEGNPVVL